MSDRAMDPVSGDLIDGPAGSWMQCETLQNQIYLSYSIPLASWEGDPGFGHRFSELARVVDSVDTRRRLEDLVRAATKWLIDLGALDHVEMFVETLPAGLAFEADHYPPGLPAISVGPIYVQVGAN